LKKGGGWDRLRTVCNDGYLLLQVLGRRDLPTAGEIQSAGPLYETALGVAAWCSGNALHL
jgi:hypothetical protein